MTMSLNTTTLPLLDALAVTALRQQMLGDVVVAGENNYNSARRLTNRRFDDRPAAIARCRNAQDVALAVKFARAQELEIAIRSGGHCVVGYSTGNGVLMIDLSQMKQIAIDPGLGIARVEPGATNGEVVLAAQQHGLATNTGTCATVGMGGSTLGGGIGWLIGRFGATIDNVLAFELVSATGELLRADEHEHPDLFWALRGGGGNFGVVTAITYKLHSLGPVLGGLAIFPLAAAAPVLRAYRELTQAAPDELVAHAVLTSIPDFGPALIVQPVYAGADLTQGEQLLAPLRAMGPAIDLIAARSYGDTYMMLTPPIPPGASSYDTAYSLRQPSDAALDELIGTVLDRPTPLAVVNIHQIHGLATRIDPAATAFALREPHYAVANIGMWIEGSGVAETAWAKETQQRMAPFASNGLYVNFLGNEGEDAIRASYRNNYARLATVKAAYDPENVFRRNQNIAPR